MGESRPQESSTVAAARTYRIAGLHGAACASRVEHALQALPGVDAAAVDLDRSLVLVQAADDVTDAALADAVERAGYTLVLEAGAEDVSPTLAPPQAAAPASRNWLDYLPPPARIWFAISRLLAIGVAASLLWTLVYRFLPAPFTLLMVSETILDGETIHQTWVPLERISPNLIRAVIASEDGEFCRHWGFDFKELQDAWEESQSGRRLRGASTISQQTAKNAFLWPGRSWLRKGLEAYFTVMIETLWPKRRIIEVYLNVIEWGPGIFGAEAASWHWFRKPAARLTQLEAARLAAILPNPVRYRANPPGPYVNRRGYTVAARANNVDLGGADRCARP